jgi:predicted transcriptional regulator
MATMTIRVPDEQHERLKKLAERQGVSLNKLFEGWSHIAIAQFDAEARFIARQERGSVKQGLKLLDKLDRALSNESTGKRINVDHDYELRDWSKNSAAPRTRSKKPSKQ